MCCFMPQWNLLEWHVKEQTFVYSGLKSCNIRFNLLQNLSKWYPSLQGVLHLLPKLECFVLYLKIINWTLYCSPDAKIFQTNVLNHEHKACLFGGWRNITHLYHLMKATDSSSGLHCVVYAFIWFLTAWGVQKVCHSGCWWHNGIEWYIQPSTHSGPLFIDLSFFCWLITLVCHSWPPTIIIHTQTGSLTWHSRLHWYWMSHQNGDQNKNNCHTSTQRQFYCQNSLYSEFIQAPVCNRYARKMAGNVLKQVCCFQSAKLSSTGNFSWKPTWHVDTTYLVLLYWQCNRTKLGDCLHRNSSKAKNSSMTLRVTSA